MQEKKDLLWPFNRTVAFLLIPLVWIVFALILTITYRYLNWPDNKSLPTAIIVILLISLFPLILRMLDYLSSRQASVETQLFKIDFSRAVVSLSNIQLESVRLPANIGIPGTAILESGAGIISVLDDATRNEVVVLDIEEGDAWWVTRLLALSAGAVRVGSPKAIVFVGTVSNDLGIFLGWVQPADALKAILQSRIEYQSHYLRAKRITQQVLLFGDEQLIPNDLILKSDVSTYKHNTEYTKRGEAAFEQILMDQLRHAVEGNPDRLTLNRLNDLFSHCLFQKRIEINQPDKEQIETFLKSEAPFIALVRNGKYESMLERSAGERLILRNLYEMMIQKKEGKP